MQKIWQRHLFFHLSKAFLFILICLFLVYAIVDLSIHGIRFFSNTTTAWTEIFSYYIHNFAKHLELFFPLTFLLASLKVLLDFSAHHEFTALQMAGLSKRALLHPFFLLAGILALAAYGNSQWLTSEEEPLQTKALCKIKKPVHHLSLKDSSELVYQNFNRETKELSDVFWIKSNKEIWHMQSFLPPVGSFVDRLQRNEQQVFEKIESFPTYTFQEIQFPEDARFEKFVSFENRPLCTLLLQSIKPTAEQKSVISHFHYKLATPLLPFFILFAIAPFAMHFSRTKSPFLLAAISLCAFIGFMTILDGMLIFGENQVLPGALAIWGLIACFCIPTLPRFMKL
jgi:lipopolysaccharide export LptBFGC system permease protein LptF